MYLANVWEAACKVYIFGRLRHHLGSFSTLFGVYSFILSIVLFFQLRSVVVYLFCLDNTPASFDG